MTDNPLEALGIAGGIVCAAGAGGKKTTLYRLADTHSGRVGLTATVFTAPPPRRVCDRRVVAEPPALGEEVLAAARQGRRIAWARPSSKPGRVAGVPPELVRELHQRGGFALTLVKADGARRRGIKAPRADEPVLVPECDTVLYMVSAAVIGAPLTEAVAHRLTELRRVTGARPNVSISAAQVARLLSHPEGALQGVDKQRLVAVITHCENDHSRAAAREAAVLALGAQPRLERVALVAWGLPQPICEVVHGSAVRAH